MGDSVHYTTCETCGAMLTERYVSRYGPECKDCQRDVGLKLWYALWGPGSVSQ